jgi:transposase
MPPRRDCQPPLESLRLWDGSALPAGLRQRLGQEWEHGQALAQRSAQLEAARRAVLQTSAEAVRKQGRPLLTLKGIGTKSAGVFVMEGFGGRACRHGQEVGAFRGLTPTPDASGNTADARGIANAGNSHVRAMAMEMAWGWRRVQPASALTPW